MRTNNLPLLCALARHAKLSKMSYMSSLYLASDVFDKEALDDAAAVARANWCRIGSLSPSSKPSACKPPGFGYRKTPAIVFSLSPGPLM